MLLDLLAHGLAVGVAFHVLVQCAYSELGTTHQSVLVVANHGLCARVLLLRLCLLANDWRCIPTGGLFLLHLAVEGLTLLEYLHEFLIDFITIELLQDVFLMFELVLGLARLLRLLLLLDHGIGVFGLVGAGVARFGLESLVCSGLAMLLGASRVLSILRSLQVLALRLGPLRMLALILPQLTGLMLTLLLNMRIVNTVLGVGILLEALAASR